MHIKPVKNQPQFGNSPVDVLVKGLQACERTPMLNVAVVDVLTAIAPRTAVETFYTPQKVDKDGKKYREPNPHAGFEAFRRESSGLIVNCLIPGVVATGIAKLIQKPIIGQNSDLAAVGANSDLLDKIKFYHKADPDATLKSMVLDMTGADGKNVKVFKEILGDVDFGKPAKEIYEQVLKKTGVAENIKFAGDEKFFSNNLKSVLSNTQKVLDDFAKSGAKDFDKYIDGAKKLVRHKSFGALALILPLAVAMQPLNRWITHKSSGRKCAPIHAEHKELSDKEKSELRRQKFVSVGAMLGVALMSLGFKKPGARMFEFKGSLPTMDQARLVSTATFASRMISSQDKDDLREATVRDIITFSGMYFLGDYVAKGIATAMEKCIPGAKLINELKPLEQGAGSLKKIKHWVKNTALKSSDEAGSIVTDALQKVNNKHLRALCQLGSLGFSLVVLGAFVPVYNRTLTNKKKMPKAQRIDFVKEGKVRFIGQ